MTRNISNLYILLVLVCWGSWLGAQHILTEAQAVALTLERHPQQALGQTEVARLQALRGTAWALPPIEVLTEAPAGDFYTIGFMQNLPLPTQLIRQRQNLGAQVAVAQAEAAVSRAALVLQARQAYHLLQYWQARTMLLQKQDSLLAGYARTTEVRYRLGQSKYLEKVSGEARARAARQLVLQAMLAQVAAFKQLALYTGSPDSFMVPMQQMLPATVSTAAGTGAPDVETSNNPLLLSFKQQVRLSESVLKLERSRIAPGISFGYLNQGPPNNPTNNNWRLGVFVPLWIWGPRSAMRSAKLGVTAAQQRQAIEEKKLSGQYLQAESALRQAAQAIQYYDATGLPQSRELIRAATQSYQLGETNYLVYLQSLEQAFGIEQRYIDEVLNHNLAVLQLLYLKGEL